MTEPDLWPVKLRLAEAQRSAPTLQLEADEGRRATLASALDLVELKRFVAQVHVTPWLDGAQIAAHWEAHIVQSCGVSLEPFDTVLAGDFTVRVVPPDSPAAQSGGDEISIDPEAEDPPDLLEDDGLDVGGYLVEHLALEIDPFPRKPGATFVPPPQESPASPFAMLRALKPGAEPTE